MYKVICYFEDLQDSSHPYNVGDDFPRVGKKVSEERLRELSTSANRRKIPLIKLVAEPVKEEVTEAKRIENQYNKTVINRMPTAELQELAKEQGVDGAEYMTGAELKKILIDKFGL